LSTELITFPIQKVLASNSLKNLINPKYPVASKLSIKGLMSTESEFLSATYIFVTLDKVALLNLIKVSEGPGAVVDPSNFHLEDCPPYTPLEPGFPENNVMSLQSLQEQLIVLIFNS
jgi:hypothetical protein